MNLRLRLPGRRSTLVFRCSRHEDFPHEVEIVASKARERAIDASAHNGTWFQHCSTCCDHRFFELVALHWCAWCGRDAVVRTNAARVESDSVIVRYVCEHCGAVEGDASMRRGGLL